MKPRAAEKVRRIVGAVLLVFLFGAIIAMLGQCGKGKESGRNTQSEPVHGASSGAVSSAAGESSGSDEIDPLGFVNAEMKNGTDLARWAELALNEQWGYVLGTFGEVLDDALLDYKIEQYPNAVSPVESFIRQNWVGGRAADCVGLIKGYVWYNADTGEIDYRAHGLPDVDAGGMYNLAEIKGSIGTMPDVPGLAVYIMGKHIGIYVGNGEVIHAMDTEHGVVKSKLTDGSWTHWLQVPGVEYEPE